MTKSSIALEVSRMLVVIVLMVAHLADTSLFLLLPAVVCAGAEVVTAAVVAPPEADAVVCAEAADVDCPEAAGAEVGDPSAGAAHKEFLIKVLIHLRSSLKARCLVRFAA